jgi:16S rRNA (uracil1498-N3)-methyltransferase
MQLFYEPNFDSSATSISINAMESRHISKVLRKTIGEEIYVTNGLGICAEGILISNHPKKCKVEVKTIIEEKKPNFRLHIAIAPTKANDRFEWFLEKATEIGIDEITPLLCDHSERRRIKAERYEKVLQAAMKQSLKYTLPILNPMVSFSDLMEMDVKSKKMIAHCEDEKKEKLSEAANRDNLILIGPEGDFSTDEIKKALKYQFIPISLSEARLRTETAGIVACHTVNLMKSI